MWEFWIDVGGTFTDCLARAPDGTLTSVKVLSTGMTQGEVEEVRGPVRFQDTRRRSAPTDFFVGYRLRLFDRFGQPSFETTVAGFDARLGEFTTAAMLPSDLAPGTTYELGSGEEAPILAIRQVLGLTLKQPIPSVAIRLGTTRGTNALLTRRGARTAFVTTRGFADVLLIANQDRPRLFDLNIEKPLPLFERVVEIDERLASDGSLLRAPQAETVRAQLREAKQAGVESLAICLLHAYANGEHERLVAEWAREVGFTEVSVSSELAPIIKLVSRGDTTVVDAYLNPILKQYVGRLRGSLAVPVAQPPSSPISAETRAPTSASPAPPRLRFMTSAGGLVDADRFVGKDSLLSGPAGGVIGFSRVAERAGFPKSIGFDMGGTSTDVSRYDGRFEYEFETKKAGVRVVAPMLAVETVAAGGGSLCDFDGVKLVVGPASAGAHPGPACYRRGGPLTITDCNLILGKIPPARFPFPLDREPVIRHLERLAKQVAAAPDGRSYSVHELAEGFVRVANANMVRAIRNISVAKGYDPRDYVLVTFGGAGAQHACALARELGMRQVLSHPWSGLLSAYGIGLADVRRFKDQAILRPLSAATLSDIEPLLRQLEQRARDEVVAEGIPASAIAPARRTLELRYKGVEATIGINTPADGDFAKAYHAEHERLYGYRHAAREIEILTARVEVVGQIPDPPDEPRPLVERRPESSETTQLFQNGGWHTAPVFSREQLHPGDRIAGPAILCEPSSTVVIDPGFELQVLSRGELLLTDLEAEARGAAARGPALSVESDPVQLEIFNNLFASIAEQMGITLQRTSFSTNVKERLDFSCAIFSATGDLVVNAPHIPVHLGAMSETVKRIISDNSEMAPGDVFVTNDPYRGGSHLPDVTVVTPVHDASARIVFFTASRAHHAEIGGIVPGSMPPFSKNLGEEGVLIRNFRLVDRGESREEALRQLLASGPYPSRSVNDNIADVAAEVAANNTGVQRLRDMIARYTWPVVEAYMRHIQRAAERKMRLALSRLPSQTYAFTDHLDEGAPITVRITVSGETAVVDFTGTGGVLASNLNANRGIVTAATLYVFRCLLREDIPLNSGVLAPVTLIVPESLLSPPENADPARSAAVVGGNVETSQRTVDVLLGALGLAAASQGTMNNLTFGNNTFGYYETICGGNGATADAAGADAVHTHMTNTRLTDVEVIERRYPVRVVSFGIRRGSGGSGKHKGGDGVIRQIEFLAPLRLSILSERRGPYPPYGLAGGQPGAFGRNTLHRHNAPTPEPLGGKVQLEVAPGDTLTLETPGGGGWGTM